MNRRRTDRRRVSKRRRSRGGAPRKYEEGKHPDNLDSYCNECVYFRDHEEDCESRQKWEQDPGDGKWYTWMEEPIGFRDAMGQTPVISPTYQMVAPISQTRAVDITQADSFKRPTTVEPVEAMAATLEPAQVMEPAPAAMVPVAAPPVRVSELCSEKCMKKYQGVRSRRTVRECDAAGDNCMGPANRRQALAPTFGDAFQPGALAREIERGSGARRAYAARPVLTPGPTFGVGR